MEKIDRRNALNIMALWSAGSLLPFSWMAQGCAKNSNPSLFDKDYQLLLASVVEIILPKTESSPGAKEANVHHFVAAIAEDCYEVEAKDRMIVGLNQLLRDGFLDLNEREKYKVLEGLDEEAKNSTREATHFFSDLKGLAQWGYFSSEKGITEGLRYNPIPGYYKGCVPYKGEIAWY